MYGSLENRRIVRNGPPIATGWIDRVDTGAVGQTGVDHRRRLVDATADLAHDLVDRAPQVVLVDELDVGALDLAAALDVDRSSGRSP